MTETTRQTNFDTNHVSFKGLWSDEDHKMEWRLHQCPQSLWSTFKAIFPDLSTVLPKRSDASKDPSKQTESSENSNILHIVIVIHQTEHDMSGYSDEVEDERFEKTGKFIDWAKATCSEIKSKSGCKFVDFVDPSSGLPYLCDRGSTKFIETDDAIFNLGYLILDFGCCKAVSHPKWGTHAFFGVIVTDAAQNILEDILSNRNAHS